MHDPMRLLVCGGRDYRDERTLFAVLDAIHRKRGVAVLIEGEAAGADKLSAKWATSRGIPVDPCAVDHAIDGPWPGAGPRRNKRMLETKKPDGVVAFPRANGEMGNGTSGMMRLARDAGLTVWEPLAKPATIRTEAAA